MSSAYLLGSRAEMVIGLRRSLSLPGGGPNPSEDIKPRHARSASVSSPSHPALSHLHHHILSLRSLPKPAKERIAVGLLGIARLHAALDDLLRLPVGQDPLRRAPSAADRLLDDFLRLADAHGSFRSAVLALRQHQSEARAAIRRRDPGRLSSAVRAHRRAEKELARLAAAVKDLTRPPLAPGLATDEAEVSGIMREAVAAIAAATAAIFTGVAEVSSAAATAAASEVKASSMVETLKKLSSTRKNGSEAVALERLEEAEECMEGLEMGSERVFRSLMNARVSLLNILTPCM